MGTHARIAGATLQLLDPFDSDRFGRKVVVGAGSRRVAASAISSLLFQLCLIQKLPTAVHQAKWHYIDPKVRLGAAHRHAHGNCMPPR